MARPLITASSAVLTTAVIDDGSTTWTAPARKRAAPTPPHSTTLGQCPSRRLHHASQPGDRFALHVGRAPSRRRRRAQLSRRLPTRSPACESLADSRCRPACIVVDNGSGDGSAERLAAVPGVELIVNESNVGFAAGNNVAIERLLDDGQRIRLGAQQRHRGRAGDAPRAARRGRRRSSASARSVRCSTTWPSPDSRADVGRRGGRAMDRSDPGCPRRRRSRRLPHRGVAAAAGQRASVRSACSTPATSSPGRTSTCAPGWSTEAGASRSPSRPRVWHRWGGTLEPLSPRRLEEHAAGLGRVPAQPSPVPWLTTLPMLGYYAFTALRERRLALWAAAWRGWRAAGDGDSDRRAELERRRPSRSVRPLPRRPGFRRLRDRRRRQRLRRRLAGRARRARSRDRPGAD